MRCHCGSFYPLSCAVLCCNFACALLIAVWIALWGRQHIDSAIGIWLIMISVAVTVAVNVAYVLSALAMRIGASRLPTRICTCIRDAHTQCTFCDGTLVIQCPRHPYYDSVAMVLSEGVWIRGATRTGALETYQTVCGVCRGGHTIDCVCVATGKPGMYCSVCKNTGFC